MADNLHLIYFSGTGNTYRVANWMAETARALGLSAVVESMEAAENNHFAGVGEANSLLGILSPTHGFTAPYWVMRFVTLLPHGKGQEAFVTFTRAGMRFGKSILPGLEGTGAYLIALLLALRGYRVRGIQSIDMPSNWTVLHPGYTAADSAAVMDHSRPTAVKFIQRLLEGKPAFGGKLALALGLALSPISLAYLVMGRFFLSKLFYASDRCNGCGLCAESCPVGGIKMKGKRPYWTFTCESCARCMNYCPKQAVEASYPFGALAFYAANIPLAALGLDWLARHTAYAANLRGSAVEWIIQYPFKLLALVVAYAMFHILMRVRWFNRLITLATPTHYYRRYHERDTRLKDIR